SNTNVHILAGHTVTLATTAGAAKNYTVYEGGTLLQQVALTVSGLTVIDGTHTMSNTLTVNDLSITGTGVLAATTAPVGSVFSLITNKATTLSINGRLGAPAGSAVTAIGSGIRIFVSGSGTTTFTGSGVVNIARFSPNSAQSANQVFVIDVDMEIRNYAGSTVASLTLQNGNNGTGAKTLTINEGKTVTLNGNNGLGAFHGQYGTGYGFSTFANTGGTMTYNINGTLDCSNAQFNLCTNQNTATNELVVNVNGKLKLGSTVRLYRYLATQKISVNVGDNGVIDGSAAALNLNMSTSGQSINTSNHTGTVAVANGLGGVTFNANNPVVGTYAFAGTGGSGYVTPPAVLFTGGTLSGSASPTYAIANLTNGVVTGITVISTGTYSVKPTGISFAGGGAPTQWFALKGDNQTGTVTRLANANTETPLWIGTATSYNPVTVKPAAATVFTANVKQGGLSVGTAYESHAINRSWTITPAAATTTDLSFGYNATDANALCNAAADMRLAAETNVLGSVAPQPAIGTSYQVSYTGVTSFAPFNLLNAGTQTITFNDMQPAMFDAAEFDANATASSELPVTLTSSDESIAKIVNGKIQPVSAGVVTITATQDGDVYYLSADAVTKQLTINKGFYADADGDGYGAGTAVLIAQNDAPAGYVTNSTDCNDSDVLVHEPIAYYADADHDGFGSNQSALFCVSTPPAGYVTNNKDCDDTRLLYADADGDGLGAGNPVACGVAGNTDCDDTNPVSLKAAIPDVYAVSASATEKNTIYVGYVNSLTIEAQPQGGRAPYTYKWNNNKTTKSITVTAAGTYTVTITDAAGCQATASIKIESINVECGNFHDKVIICHNGHSECISASAVATHLKHGDKLGYCNDNDAIGDVVVYPNPVIGGNVFVKTPDYLKGKQMTVTITDLMGKVVQQQVEPNNDGTIEIRLNKNIRTGIYLVKVNNVFVTKLIVLQ
ncbi:MAG TPA: T9SS type A sorting domain-containing protein, partial [Niastella sp.]